MRIYLVILALIFAFGCYTGPRNNPVQSPPETEVTLIVLGTLQDGGSPHAGCKKECCRDRFEQPDATRKVVSLGLIDHKNKTSWLFEASPDLPSQMKHLKEFSGKKDTETPDGIFLTHAHIGHYAGLMHLGREAMNAKEVKVFAMPTMKNFIETNGPWSQLITLNNIQLQTLKADSSVILSPNLRVTPFIVPHRDEFSETVGYKIEGPEKKVLFIPDIDKWQKWDRSIVEELRAVDYALVDGTFFSETELNNRSMAEIPHPLVKETMLLLDTLPLVQKKKVFFIHLNHTNPLLDEPSPQRSTVLKSGYNIAEFKIRLAL